MSTPDDPIPLSALQHWSYCPRQCALIHLEQAFADNVHTLRGQATHAAVDMPGFEAREGVRAERALPLWSDEYGLIGKADVVEFSQDGTPYPVEYKHGKLTRNREKQSHDDLQLAGQAICLQEMTGRLVPEGAVFQASSKRRRVVPMTSELKGRVVLVAQAIREMLANGRLPPPLVDSPRCKECSLIDICEPHGTHQANRVARNALFDPEA
jgi:CRISPR-associated exonuclease Cas4